MGWSQRKLCRPMAVWRAAARAVLRGAGAALRSHGGSADGPSSCSVRFVSLSRTHILSSLRIPGNYHCLLRNAGISSTRSVLAAEDAMVPVSSPLTPPLGDAEATEKKGIVVKRLKVQAIKKDIRQDDTN